MLGLAALFALAAGGYALARGGRNALEAERGLQSTVVAGAAVDAFIRAQNPPRWPASWDELATVEYADHPWIHWPRDRGTIEPRVAIDFSATLADVAVTTPESFNAIRPTGPCYSGWRRDLAFVAETARRLTQP